MPSNRNRGKTLTGSLDKEWTEHLDRVLPRSMTIHAFTSVAVKAMIQTLVSGEKIAEDTSEVLALRSEVKYLKQLISESYRKAGLK
jgi:hypothetical protein